MNQVDLLKNKIEKISSSGTVFDAANVVLKDLEDAILELHHKIQMTIDCHIAPDGEHHVQMEYRRGDVQGQRGTWGLFIRERVTDNIHDCYSETSWHWAQAPGVIRVKASEYKDQFISAASQIADAIISELPQ